MNRIKEIKWELLNSRTWLRFPRIHKLSNNTLACITTNGNYKKVIIRYSYDNGKNWSSDEIVYDATNTNYYIFNIDFTEVDNVIHVVMNFRPVNKNDNKYLITYINKENNIWGNYHILYYGGVSTTDPDYVGVYEPCIIELYNKNLGVFFANEFTESCTHSQNISLIEIDKNGNTIKTDRVASYSNGKRDGMPVVKRLRNLLLLAIEDNSDYNLEGVEYHITSIIKQDYTDPFKETVGVNSENRIIVNPGENHYYGGAPYIAVNDFEEVILTNMNVFGNTQIGIYYSDYNSQDYYILNSPLEDGFYRRWSTVEFIDNDTVILAFESINSNSEVITHVYKGTLIRNTNV